MGNWLLSLRDKVFFFLLTPQLSSFVWALSRSSRQSEQNRSAAAPPIIGFSCQQSRICSPLVGLTPKGDIWPVNTCWASTFHFDGSPFPPPFFVWRGGGGGRTCLCCNFFGSKERRAKNNFISFVLLLNFVYDSFLCSNRTWSSNLAPCYVPVCLHFYIIFISIVLFV